MARITVATFWPLKPDHNGLGEVPHHRTHHHIHPHSHLTPETSPPIAAIATIATFTAFIRGTTVRTHTLFPELFLVKRSSGERNQDSSLGHSDHECDKVTCPGRRSSSAWVPHLHMPTVSQHPTLPSTWILRPSRFHLQLSPTVAPSLNRILTASISSIDNCVIFFAFPPYSCTPTSSRGANACVKQGLWWRRQTPRPEFS